MFSLHLVLSVLFSIMDKVSPSFTLFRIIFLVLSHKVVVVLLFVLFSFRQDLNQPLFVIFLLLFHFFDTLEAGFNQWCVLLLIFVCDLFSCLIIFERFLVFFKIKIFNCSIVVRKHLHIMISFNLVFRLLFSHLFILPFLNHLYCQHCMFRSLFMLANVRVNGTYVQMCACS